jgi:site-specific DNA recombinase
LRLAKLYDAHETGKFSFDDLAPRIKEHRDRQDELYKVKLLVEAEMVVHGVTRLEEEKIKTYVSDLRQLLEESELIERKSFLKSFIKKIVVDNEHGTIYYRLPMGHDGKDIEETGVLPMVTSGGEEGTRTPTPFGT